MLAGARVKTSIFVIVLDNDWGAMMMMMLNNNRSAIMLNHNAAMVAVVGPLEGVGMPIQPSPTEPPMQPAKAGDVASKRDVRGKIVSSFRKPFSS